MFFQVKLFVFVKHYLSSNAKSTYKIDIRLLVNLQTGFTRPKRYDHSF